ncbi:MULTISPECIES: helix-turn-helix transcriptional regulator [Niastella]|uniref:Helix-turn-helix transcriptional regulator n=1 Tax=Niastella soli TaxID=2821487 RepID=A0ABS3YZC5_9BACT|nr:AraC family transcriptional regulator [Niastella soli]MBO9203284.1 helix-turn-helix transcriptional regulator [Niastella soli]
MRNRKKLKKHVVIAITAAKQIFDNNLGDEYTAYRMALTYGVSRNVLQKAFKDEYGAGIRDYRLRIRMEKSKDLLALGKDAKEVSITLHYSNPSAFNNAFKKYYKVTPKEMFDFTDGDSLSA